MLCLLVYRYTRIRRGFHSAGNKAQDGTTRVIFPSRGSCFYPQFCFIERIQRVVEHQSFFFLSPSWTRGKLISLTRDKKEAKINVKIKKEKFIARDIL